jgi:UDP-N-acetylenolpyruvoylglucosamine reductase
MAQPAAWRARELRPNPVGGTDFLLEREGRMVGPVSLPLAGEHNVRNFLGALAAAEAAGYVFTEPVENLKISRKLTGTARRLEHKGESCGIIVLDDYAHHPTEVRATLSAVRQRFPRRTVWALFQPHTYSRTRALLHDFCGSFENADHVLITDIYAAREHDTMGVSSHDLVAGLGTHPDARYVGGLNAASERLLSELAAGDVLVTLGAGDGYRVGEQVLEALRAEEVQPELSSDQRQELLAQAIEQELGLPVRRQESLSAHTTMRVGGPADLLVVATQVEDVVAVASLARRWSVSLTLLGGGSNVVVSDLGVRGLVVINACRAVRRHEGHVVWAEAGANLAGLARQTLRWGLSGLEWGVSVPGTVGGAVVGNAGAHGGSVADNLVRATLLQPDGSLAEWQAACFRYGYRTSALKTSLRMGEPAPIVVAAAFQLEPADPLVAEERAAGFLAHRRSTQPVEPSAGSIFQNPPGDFAGRILDSLGFKGRGRGGAAFSTVHANFIVNQGGATAEDIVGLINEAREAVWQTMGVALEPEILFVGDWTQGMAVAPPGEQDSRRSDESR